MKSIANFKNWLIAACLPFVAILFIGISSISVFASSELNASDSSSIVNYYNPASSFTYLPANGIQPNENEMRAGLLYDLENKKIVWQKAMNTPYPIASLTKMMVALLTVEDIRAGKVNWTDNVGWTRNVVIGKGKRKKIVGECVNYSLFDIFKAAMIASNNEAAEQMARYVGGDVQTFVDRMNTRARELGMNSTYYGNPTGLPATARNFDNSSTPTDLLMLTLEMLKYDEILKVTGMGYADISNGKNTSVIRNHNHLTIDYKGEVDGMKTGYTKRAGFCLVATSNKCEQRLISIVLGARSPNLRNEVVKDMINDYYSAIGLDKLGPYCVAPSVKNDLMASQEDGFVTRTVTETYLVKQGEDINSIAYRFNCSPSDIIFWNKLRSRRLAPGKKINIFTQEKVALGDMQESGEEFEASTVAEGENSELAEATPSLANNTDVAAKPIKKSTASFDKVTAKSKFIIHVVQPGDTLFSIAKLYDLASIAKLKAVNKIAKGNKLKVGSKIKVPVKG